jgi:hypothetical protein
MNLQTIIFSVKKIKYGFYSLSRFEKVSDYENWEYIFKPVKKLMLWSSLVSNSKLYFKIFNETQGSVTLHQLERKKLQKWTLFAILITIILWGML